MRIGIFVGSISGGGAERFASTLASGLSKKNEVSLITFTRKEHEYPLSKSVKRENLNISINYRGIKKFYSFIQKNSYDIYIGIDLMPNILLSSVKLINTKYKVIISERNAPKQTKLNILWKILRFFLYAKADKIVFQTEDARVSYRKVISKKGVVIPNPIRKNIPYRDKKMTCNEIIAVGRLNQQKNYDLLLYAFKSIHEEYPDYKLRIFGQGVEEEHLKNLGQKLKIQDYILFEGYKEELNELMKYSDIFVMTSKYEGMPNALIEAMAMGFPVISSDCPSGGPKALIKDHENGILFKNNNLEQLILSMKEVLGSTQLKEKLSKNAVKIRDELNAEKIICMWEKLIENTILLNS